MSSRAILYKLYWSFRRIIAPELRYSQDTYEHVLQEYMERDANWLDLGCGHALLPHWRSEKEKELVKSCKALIGVDYDLESLKTHCSLSMRVRGDIKTLPFKSHSFDLVTANMVVEHLECPEEQFQEIRRILKPKGRFLFHTPNAVSYGVVISRLVPDRIKEKLIYLLEGRQEEDVFKTYYRANTEKEIIELASKSGFKVAKIDMLVTDAIMAVVPPLFIPELLWIRVLMTKPFRSLRTNIVAVLDAQ